MKVKLLKTICGAYRMAHFAGEVIEVTEAIGTDMIQNEFAELVKESEPKETEPKKTEKKSK